MRAMSCTPLSFVLGALLLPAFVHAAPPDDTLAEFRERAAHARRIDSDPGTSPQYKVWIWQRVQFALGPATEGLEPSAKEVRRKVSTWSDAIPTEHQMWRDWFGVVDAVRNEPDDASQRVAGFLRTWEAEAPKSTAVQEARALAKSGKAGPALAQVLVNLRKKAKLRGFVRVDPGAFSMGSPLDEALRNDDETRHDVELHWPFWLSETEVTQREWGRLMGSSPSWFKGAGLEAPVDSVSFPEVTKFLNAMSRAEGLEECYVHRSCEGEDKIGAGCHGKPLDNATCESDFTCYIVMWSGTACGGYRLPTEAEWEYAARAGTTTATHVGDFDGKNLVSYPKLEPYAVFAPTSIVTYEGGSSCNPAVKALADKTCGPARVGSRKPNPWGFFDMLGNVFEMVNDYALNNSPYLRRNDRGPETNPTGPAQTGWGHVVRGGTWLYSAKEARAASRHRLKDDRRGVMVGFRVARTIR